MDSVYSLSFSVTNLTETLTLVFSGIGLESLQNESWGLDNVKLAFEGSVGALSNVVTGPSTVSAGSVTPYTCVAQLSDGGTLDVTAQAQWTVQPPDPLGSMFNGNYLVAPSRSVVSSDHPVTIKATYTNGNVTVSSTKTVTVQPAFTVSLEVESVAYNPCSRLWQVHLKAVPIGATGTVSYNWDTDGNGIYGDASGQQVTPSFMQTGPRTFGVDATDGTGAHALALRKLALNSNAYCGGTELPPPEPYATDIAGGAFMDKNGGNTDPIISGRIDNGLLIIVHGMCANVAGSDWMTNMAAKVEARLAYESRPLPNIMLYDWHEMADPSVFAGLPNSDLCPLEQKVYDDLLSGVNIIRPYALAHGLKLADWIQAEIASGKINPSKPIQIVAHSAGGYVASACAVALPYVTTQITLLDSPAGPDDMTDSYIAKAGGGKVDEYIQSPIGELGSQTKVSVRIGHPSRYLYSIFDPPVTLGDVFKHAYPHIWYRETITNSETSGFYYSPWLGNSFPSLMQSFSIAGLVSVQSTQEQPIDGFSTFGFVTNANGTNTITEAADAGIYKTMTLPVGAQTLKFSFRFTSPGDGDFLSVYWGTNALLYVGLDLPLTRANYIDAEVALSESAGQTDTLTFKLVSRGSTNAVLSVASIRMSLSDDPDGDGLTTDQEVALGTDPQKYDTDGDGLSDGDEVNVTHTNPLLADTDGDGMSDWQEYVAGSSPTNSTSVFQITGIQTASGMNMLTWTSATGKNYSVYRTTDLSWSSFTTLVTNIAATPPSNTFTDAPPSSLTNFFYRVGVQ